jgi:bifunctional DNase/RNase
MIKMNIVGVRVELPTNQPIVLLQEETGETARPMTHDLFKNVLGELSVSVEQVLINDLVDGTFFAEITMCDDGDKHVISARPSDAIALAVRMDVPIFADEGVLDEASIVMETADEEEIERFRDFLDHVEPQDFL